jgi:DNA-binding transcriptional LysR family regulator
MQLSQTLPPGNGLPPVPSRPSMRELEVLVAMVQTGKTTAAAERLGVSQPAVSRAIAGLETSLGRALFERDGGRLVANSEALRLAEQVAPLLAALDGFNGIAPRNDTATPLKIAAPPSIAHRFMPGLIAGFLDANPGQTVHMEIGMTEAVVASVANANAHLGISDGFIKHNGVVAHPYLRGTGHVVLRADHRLAQRESLRPEDLDGEAFIALTPRFHRRFIYDKIFHDHRVGRRVVVETATSIAVCEMVRAGLGVGIINPFPVALRNDDGLAYVPFLPRVEYLSSFLCPLGPVSPVAQRFIEHARRAAPRDPRFQPA